MVRGVALFLYTENKMITTEQRLTFSRQELQDLITHTRQNPLTDADGDIYWSNGRGDRSGTPMILLVGDEGVYFMSGGKYIEDRPVVYANECNPETASFDDWWAVKNDTWGGDDGVEALVAEDVERMINTKGATNLILEFRGDEIVYFIQTKK